MNLCDFAYHLETVLTLSRMNPQDKEYRRMLKHMAKLMNVDIDFLPVSGKRRWMITEVVYALIAACLPLSSFILFPFKNRLTENQIGTAIVLLLFFAYAALVVSYYAHRRKTRLTRQYLDQRVALLGSRLELLSADQLRHAARLLSNVPDHIGGDNSMKSASCGCWKCALAFDAEVTTWEDFDPVCPECSSDKHLIFGDDEVPVTEEILQIIHDLFEEN